MTPNHATTPIPSLRRLTTSGAAAWAGVLPAVLFRLSPALVRLSPDGGPTGARLVRA